MLRLFTWHLERLKFVLQPWQLLLLILAGWINRHQQKVIEYLQVENQVLKEKLGKKRLLLSDDQRRCLAVKGELLGRKALQEVNAPPAERVASGSPPEVGIRVRKAPLGPSNTTI
jgi:hypothetical protein